MKISALFLFSLFVFSVYSSYVSVNVTDTSSTFTDTVTLNFTINQYVFSVPYVNSTNFNQTLVAYIDIDSDSSETFNGTIDFVALQISTTLSATNDFATAGELQAPVNLNITSEDASDCWVYKAATDADTYYGFVVVTFTDTEADNTTGTVGVDVKINYQDSCDTSDLSNSGGNGWIWFVVIGAVAVVVVILIVAGVAGFLFYKKKNQQQFDLYNDS